MTDDAVGRFNGRIIQAGAERASLPDGSSMIIDMVRHPGAAAVLVLDAQNRVCMLRQYRPALADWLWEIPAGKLDHGEAPALAAQRELAEETGLHARDWQPLGSVATAPGFCDEIIHLYLARELENGTPNLEEHEILEVHWLPLAEMLQWADSGRITDGKTLAALLRVRTLA